MAAAVASGTLESLDQLEQLTNHLGDQQRAAVSQELSQLQSQIDRLRQKRDVLLGRSRSRRRKILCDTFTRRDIPLTPKDTVDLSDRNRIYEKEDKVKHLEALAAAYRLTGLSCETIQAGKKSNLLLRWDTSYQGTYMEPYYSEIQLKPEYKILHHTLPVFIPVAELEKKMKVSIAEFAVSVRTYLQAFVARRQIALQVKESLPESHLATEIHTTAAASCLQVELVNMKHFSDTILVILIFDNLTKSSLTRVHIKNRGEANSRATEAMNRLKQNLLKGDIVKQLQEFLRAYSLRRVSVEPSTSSDSSP